MQKKTLGAESFCAQTIETQTRLDRKAFPTNFVLQRLHKALPSTTVYHKSLQRVLPSALCTTKLAQSTSQYYFVLQHLHKLVPSTTLYYKACTNYFPVRLSTTKACKEYFPVLLCTTKLEKSISQYYFVLQNLHKLLPSTTVYYKSLQKSTSQYYFVLQRLHKARSSTTLYHKACTKHFPVLLCTTNKVCTKHFPVLLCTTKACKEYFPVLFVLQSLQRVLPSALCTTKLAQSTSQYYWLTGGSAERGRPRPGKRVGGERDGPGCREGSGRWGGVPAGQKALAGADGVVCPVATARGPTARCFRRARRRWGATCRRARRRVARRCGKRRPSGSTGISSNSSTGESEEGKGELSGRGARRGQRWGEVPKATRPPNRSQVATDRLTREPSVTPATSTPWRVRTAGSMGGARPAAGLLCTKRLAKSTSQYYSALQSLHKPLPSHNLYYTKSAPITTLYYTACKKYFPVLLCTTKLAQSTS